MHKTAMIPALAGIQSSNSLPVICSGRSSQSCDNVYNYSISRLCQLSSRMERWLEIRVLVRVICG